MARFLLFAGALLYALAPMVAAFLALAYVPEGLSDTSLRAQNYTSFFQGLGGSCFAVGAVERIAQAICHRT